MGTENFLILWIYALTALVIALAIYAIVLTVRLKQSTELIRAFYSGTKADSFEKTILEYIKYNKKREQDLQELANFSNKVYSLASKAPYKMGLVRFNPFGDVGGNQSFAIALLDRKKTGIVISSLYGREGTRMYAKPVHNGESLEGYGFSKEEKESIEKASSKKVQGFKEIRNS